MKPDDSEDGEEADLEAEAGGAQAGGRFAPMGERRRIHAAARLFGEDGEFLAQVQAVAQFVDGLLPVARRLPAVPGALSHCARRSSPMWVRAVQSSSKTLPLPKRSRSSA